MIAKKPHRPAPVVRHNCSTSSVFAAAFEEVFGSFRIQPIQQQDADQQKKKEDGE